MKIPNNNILQITIKPEEMEDYEDPLKNDTFHDPLDQVGVEEIFYRLDNVVFAEPLNVGVTEDICANQVDNSFNGEISFIDNVAVRKADGTDRKNKKYFINIEDPAHPICPQPNCSRSFSTTTLLKAHVRKVHCADRKKFVCDRCGSGFPAEYLLRRHSAVHEKRQVECPVCHKMLSERTNLSVHVRSHAAAAARAHACPRCARRFVRRGALAAHLQFVHRTGDLLCGDCHATFRSRAQWSRHRLVHKQSKTTN